MAGHMVIVGAGECGTRAAFALREHGFDGDVTLVGAEAHLPYERPPLSKDGMLAETFMARTIATAERLADAGISYRPSTHVAGIARDGRRLLVDGATLNYDRLLLATGAEPRRLPEVAGERIVYLRTLDDALAIRAVLGPALRLVVIGGGFIGLELAASARHHGAEVTVIEALPRLLARAVPEALGGMLQKRHEAAGVRFQFGDPIAAVNSGEDSATVQMASGKVFEADLVLVGIGAIPHTALAAGARLAIANGIAVDEQLRTDDPAIWAAGDCCSFPLRVYGGRRVRLESWRNAQDQGALAARNMLGAGEPFAGVPWFWSDQYELGLQIVGLGDEGTEIVRRDGADGTTILFHRAGDGRLVAAGGLGPGTAVAKDIRLAERLILAGASPTAAQLGDPAVKLKALLTA